MARDADKPEAPVHADGLGARADIPHAWLLDPLALALEVFRPEDGFWLFAASHEGTEVVRAEPFEAIGLSLGDLWPGAEERPGEPGGA